LGGRQIKIHFFLYWVAKTNVRKKSAEVTNWLISQSSASEESLSAMVEHGERLRFAVLVVDFPRTRLSRKNHQLLGKLQ
jgi:hypothetical protein